MKNFETWDEVWAELKEKYPETIAEAEKIREEMEKEYLEFLNNKKKEEIKKETKE